MANPVTSIINPLGNRILLFFVTAEQQLALDQTPLEENITQLSYESHGTPKGNFALSQCISAVYLRGMPTVYGMVLSDDKKSLIVSQLSPITNLVAAKGDQARTTTTVPSFGAASDEADKAYFYFLRKPSPDSDTVMMETTLKFDVAQTRPMPDLKPSEKSRVAVAYVKEKKDTLVFFQVKQNTDNNIYWLWGTSNSTAAKVVGTQNALDGTPLAVTQSTEGHTHLYWMSTQNYLQRATRLKGADWVNTSDTITPFSTMRLANSSQIAVTQVGKGADRRNVVFYIESDDEKYRPHYDVNLGLPSA